MSLKDNDKNIYIVLIKALTGLGKFSRKLQKYKYTHIAVCLDNKLEDFITFSRKKHYSPFNAGFMHEKVEHYAFGKHKKVKVKIFKLPVTTKNYKIIEKYIKEIESDKDYIFNLYSMITMPIFHGIKIYKAHNCMSFTSKIIELSNCISLSREYYKYDIKEIDELLNNYLDKETFLEKSKEDTDYMSRVGIIKNIKSFFVLNGKLIYRIIFKRKKYME